MVNSYNLQNSSTKTKTENGSNRKTYLNEGQDDEMEIEGYVFDKVKMYTTYTFYVVTLGLLRLFFHWYPHFHLKATHRKCNLKNAEKILVIDKYKKFKFYFVEGVETLKADRGSHNFLTFNYCDGKQKRLVEARVIRCKKLTYIWDEETSIFKKLAGLDTGLTKSELREFEAQTEEAQDTKRIVYGYNEINVPVQTVLSLVVLEALTPFYIFQIFSLIVWLLELYLYYTIAIIIMSVVGITTSVIQTRKNQKNLRGTINIKDTIYVCRSADVFEEISTTNLVPGDIILIPTMGGEVQCDAILLNGGCVVNESMLTGESVPITKTPLPNSFTPFNIREDGNHVLFCGTKVIQTKSKADEKILALVIRTGYLTTKGELVRSILYPPPADFKFETDSYKFIAMLSVIAVLSVIHTIISKFQRNINPLEILIKSLDVITIAIPPALPATMTVGKLYASHRLKKKQIFCINSRVINVSGSIDCICFDKTGTLTADELDLWGIVPIEKNTVQEPLLRNKNFREDSALLRGMATCHSLSIIDGNLGGDPLDIKMFAATECLLHDRSSTSGSYHVVVKSEKRDVDICIIRQFQFSSALQRMSVITKASDSSQYEVFCKGAPETIMTLSKKSSVPDDLLDRLSGFTSQGYRVIAMATKRLTAMTSEEIEDLDRKDVESDLDLIGLIVLENKMKPETQGVVHALKNADMKVVMITGDNLKTALHVARESLMVDSDESIIEVIVTEPKNSELPSVHYEIRSYAAPKVCTKEYQISKPGKNQQHYNVDAEKNGQNKYCFAINGTSWANLMKYFPQLVSKIVARGTVFARMTGLQKQQLVEELKNLGYFVAMCGDGANDCGALKAAHVGISLSEAESSVASPFTSKQQNISCVPRVIKEGRAALVTSFGVFKTMVCYSLVELASVIILYSIDANLSSAEFLFIDLCLILNFASTFGLTKAYPALSTTPPSASLMSVVPVTSILCFLSIATGFQVFANSWIQTYEWFTPFIYRENVQSFICYENYVVFCVSMFQYITMAVVFSKGKPYRRALYTNRLLMLSLLATTSICLYMTLFPHEIVSRVMELKVPPMQGRVATVVISFVCFLCCFIAEEIFVDIFLDKLIMKKISMNRNSTKLTMKVSHFDLELPVLRTKDLSVCDISERVQNGKINNGFIGSTDVLTQCH